MYFLYPQLLQLSGVHVCNDMYTYRSGSNTQFILYNIISMKSKTLQIRSIVGLLFERTYFITGVNVMYFLLMKFASKSVVSEMSGFHPNPKRKTTCRGRQPPIFEFLAKGWIFLLEVLQFRNYFVSESSQPEQRCKIGALVNPPTWITSKNSRSGPGTWHTWVMVQTQVGWVHFHGLK